MQVTIIPKTEASWATPPAAPTRQHHNQPPHLNAIARYSPTDPSETTESSSDQHVTLPDTHTVDHHGDPHIHTTDLLTESHATDDKERRPHPRER